ncbi:MAG: ceramidase domain-containing protein [Betaproteobacteria bacterium]|nr:ceramidase domain-containing protein [Betaproteobacteria bacterium]
MMERQAFSIGRHRRELALVLVALLPLAALLAADPIPQDPSYHDFADRRAFFGVPNLLNVASNVLFLVVGVSGLWFSLKNLKAGAAASWGTLFLGTALVFFGSGYYHWAPDNATLVWDRLPMTLAFMGIFVALVSEHVDERLERVLLVPALLAGAASVAWWHYTDDLRPYIWVQGVPLLAIPVVLVAYAGQHTHRSYLLYGLAFYVLAKLAEFYDHELFALTAQAISGHSLKHLLAAFGPLFVLLMLMRRRAVGTS